MRKDGIQKDEQKNGVPGKNPHPVLSYKRNRSKKEGCPDKRNEGKTPDVVSKYQCWGRTLIFGDTMKNKPYSVTGDKDNGFRIAVPTEIGVEKGDKYEFVPTPEGGTNFLPDGALVFIKVVK